MADGILKVGTITTSSGSGTITIPSGVTLSGGGVGGVSQADLWRITANTTINSTATALTANWSRNENAASTYVGTGMTESSGVFSFPSTGKYWVRAVLTSSGGATAYVGIQIHVTTDNSTYTEVAHGYGSTSAADYNHATSDFLFDVTDVSNCKTKFYTLKQGANSINAQTGGSGKNSTYVMFIRLGDT